MIHTDTISCVLSESEFTMQSFKADVIARDSNSVPRHYGLFRYPVLAHFFQSHFFPSKLEKKGKLGLEMQIKCCGDSDQYNLTCF